MIGRRAQHKVQLRLGKRIRATAAPRRRSGRRWRRHGPLQPVKAAVRREHQELRLEEGHQVFVDLVKVWQGYSKDAPCRGLGLGSRCGDSSTLA